MRAAAATLIESVSWDSLQHAYGAATDIPPLLRALTAAKGRKLYETMDELCSRVLHQGTIYSASPAVARAVIGMLEDMGPREKASFYSLLLGLANSARQAIAAGRAGEPADGAAIRDAILEAGVSFVPDLAHSDAELRGQAAELLTAFAESRPAMARLVRERYSQEADPIVRRAMLDGLERVRASFQDWPAFLSAALERETAVANRYVLRRAQVCHLQSASDSAVVDDLVSTFVQVHATEHHIFVGDEPFFRAIHLLGADREQASLLKALDDANNHGLSRVLAERLLRQVFGDRRTGWEDTSFSYEGDEKRQGSLHRAAFRTLGMLLAAKLFPSLMRRLIRKNAFSRGNRKESIKYWGIAGDAPAIPAKLTAPQNLVLTTLARDAAVWRFHTNLWDLFGLPHTAAGLRSFIAARS